MITYGLPSENTMSNRSLINIYMFMRQFIWVSIVQIKKRIQEDTKKNTHGVPHPLQKKDKFCYVITLGCFSFWSHCLVGCDPLHSTAISHTEQIAHLSWGVGRSPTLQSNSFIFCRWPGTEKSTAILSCFVLLPFVLWCCRLHLPHLLPTSHLKAFSFFPLLYIRHL